MAKRLFSDVTSTNNVDSVNVKRVRPSDNWNDENDKDALRSQYRLDNTFHTPGSSDVAEYDPPTSKSKYTLATPPPSIEQIIKRLDNENFRESPLMPLPHISETKLESMTADRSRLRQVLETSPSELHKIGRAKTGVYSNVPVLKHAVTDTRERSSLMNCANNSSASLWGASHSLSAAEELAEEFWHRLKEKLPLYLGSSADQNEIYRNFLVRCLRRYWMDLKREASTSLEMEAYRFVGSHVSELASIIISRSGYPLAGFPKWDANEYNEAVVDSPSNLAQVGQFLVDGLPFRSFFERVSAPNWNELVGWYESGQDISGSHLLGMEEWEFSHSIHSNFKHCLGHTGVEIRQVNFIVRWEMEKFIREELEGGSDLFDVFTVTGSPERAYAGTALEYITKTWPRSGVRLLDVVHGLCWSSNSPEDPIHIAGHDLEMYFKRLGVNPYNFEGSTKSEENDGIVSITVRGSQSEVIEVAQQLAWMTASFRAAVDQKLHVSRAIFNYIKEIDCFRLEPAPLSAVDHEDVSGSCWHPLLLGSLVVPDFPIPEGRKGVGLEISFDLMVYLAGIRYPIMYNGRMVLKGDTHTLVPTRHNSEFTQWHCLSTNSSDKTKLALILEKCSYRMETTDINTLRETSRTFLGYYQRANVCLGTRDYKGENIKLSEASLEKRRLQFSRTLSPQLGFQFFAQFTVGSKVKFSKTLRGTTKAKTIPYGLKLDRFRKQPVVLCDVATKRDWLVPELSLVLEIVRIILSSRKDLDDRVLRSLPYAEASPDGGLAALDAIRKGESLILRPQQGKCPPETFIEIIHYVMDALDGRRSMNEEVSEEDSITLQKSSTFYGWELKDIIDLRTVWNRREICIDKAAGSWPRDIALHPGILTLFCKDLPDPISPTADAAACSTWFPLPEGKHYLAASVRCLREVEPAVKVKKVRRKDLQRLQSLERPKIFDDCTPSTCRGCNRLQDLRTFNLAVNSSDESTQDSVVILGDPFLYTPTEPDQRRQNGSSNAVVENITTIGNVILESPVTPKDQHFASSSPHYDDLSSSPPSTPVGPLELSPRKDHLMTSVSCNSPTSETLSHGSLWTAPNLKYNGMQLGMVLGGSHATTDQTQRLPSEGHELRLDREVMSESHGNSKLPATSPTQLGPLPDLYSPLKARPFDDNFQASQPDPDDS